MNVNHLTDNELLDYVIRYDNDPIRVRIATHMQRLSGEIISDLESAGMDDTFCTFASIVNYANYHPGQYITHLENEVEYLQDKISGLHKELEELKARTVMDLIVELKQEIKTAEFCAKEARRDAETAQENEKIMKSKLDMWAIMNR